MKLTVFSQGYLCSNSLTANAARTVFADGVNKNLTAQKFSLILGLHRPATDANLGPKLESNTAQIFFLKPLRKRHFFQKNLFREDLGFYYRVLTKINPHNTAF